MENRIVRTQKLAQATGILEEPFGVCYTEVVPEGAFGPKEGPEVSRALEQRGEINFQSVFSDFSCIMGNIWLARKKKRAAYLSQKEYGCFGGSYYAGFLPEHLRLQENYVSTGLPGTPMHGERYIASPEAMCQFLDHLAPAPAPSRYCVFKPITAFTEHDNLEIVVFFARMESIVGLQTLVYYTTGDVNAVVTHFGSACSHIISWPRHYMEKGLEKAVLGGCDPSARKFMKTDEMLLAIPVTLYDKMLDAMPTSLLGTETWKNVMKKVNKSNSVWNDKAR